MLSVTIAMELMIKISFGLTACSYLCIAGKLPLPAAFNLLLTSNYTLYAVC